MACACAEGILSLPDGSQRRLPGRHDCAYIKARNALIPEAVTAANLGTKPKEDRVAWSVRFCAAMDQLVKERIHGRVAA